jgi:hypothetical protein
MNKANVTSARRTRQARKRNIPRETLGSENRRLFLSANLGFLLRQLRRVREVRSSELSRLLPYCAGSYGSRSGAVALIQIRLHVEGLADRGLSRPETLTVLRGQLTLLRMRAERGIAISVDLLIRAERLARTLELSEVPA